MKRRSFIQKSSIATAGMVTAFHIPSFAQNKKLKIGLIGAGWYGMVITEAALKIGNVEVIAVCDIVENGFLSGSACFTSGERLHYHHDKELFESTKV